MSEAKYKRILLKLSGEAIAGNKGNGIDTETLNKICDAIKEVKNLGVEIGIVVGGGNFWRGRNSQDIDRTTSDYMGMLATVLNGLALQDTLESKGLETRVQTSIEMRQIAEPFIRRKAVNHLQKGRIVIFAGGTGNPFFTTDTTATLRAAEIEADVILVGKTIDGVYSDDPKKNANARKYDEITYLEMLNKNLQVMDSTAISMCMDNKLPLIVFAIEDPNNIVRVVKGENIKKIINN